VREDRAPSPEEQGKEPAAKAEGRKAARRGQQAEPASIYDPSVPGYRSGGVETATGEHYDPSEWAGAIQTDLRGEFGGLLHGAKPSFAVVESTDKKVIAKINDVGPLEPGCVIDFDKQTMRYFDPTLSAV
jgi:rare lipoprotein A